MNFECDWTEFFIFWCLFVLLESLFVYEFSYSSENFQTSLFCYRMALASNIHCRFPSHIKFSHELNTTAHRPPIWEQCLYNYDDENDGVKRIRLKRIVSYACVLYFIIIFCRMEMLLMVGSWMRTHSICIVNLLFVTRSQQWEKSWENLWS